MFLWTALLLLVITVLPSNAVLAVAIFLGAGLFLWCFGLFTKVYYGTSDKYSLSHPIICSVPRICYLALAVIELVVFLLCVHMTWRVNNNFTENWYKNTDSIDDENVKAVLRGGYKAIPAPAVTLIVDKIVGDDFVIDGIYTQDEWDAMLKHAHTQCWVCTALWVLLSVIRYPSRVFNTYLKLLRRERRRMRAAANG